MKRTTRRLLLRLLCYGVVLGAAGAFVSRIELHYNWNWGRFFDEWAHILLDGIVLTLKVALASISVALPLGVLIGLCRTASDPGARLLGFLFVEVFRGTPLLVQVMVWYHVLAGPLGLEGLGQAFAVPLGDVVDPEIFAAAVCALSSFAGAYIAEIVRAGIQSVDRGQMEAARSLGLSHFQALRTVVIPQALRRIMPPLASEFIALVKDSSLASVIGLQELTMSTRVIQSSAYMTFEPWLTTAALYLVINVVLSLGVRLLEKKLGVAHQEQDIR